MVILDTGVMVDSLRQYPPAVAWMASLGDEEIALPGFVAMELIQGCRNQDKVRQLEKVLRDYEVLWPSPEMCNAALASFARLHLGHGVGILDALISQLAVDLDLPLHTFNQKHYDAIPGLRTVQPYQKN